MLRKLYNDEAGVIISAELVLVLTIAVLAMVVGLSEVAVAINTELNDLSNAFGSIDQSFKYTGFEGNNDGGGTNVGTKIKSSVAGSTFNDREDDCDNNTSCDLVLGAANRDSNG